MFRICWTAEGRRGAANLLHGCTSECASVVRGMGCGWGGGGDKRSPSGGEMITLRRSDEDDEQDEPIEK